MKNDVNSQEMLRYKISKDPRFFFISISISSTIRASVAQKPKPFFSMERSQQGMPLKVIKKIADFRKFYYTTFLVNLHHFSYFDPAKKSAIFFL